MIFERYQKVASAAFASREGSLLVMSVVLLGVIAFTSIFMSLTLIYEIKSTRFSDNAAVAYYAAESGAEDALFRLRRSKEFSDPEFFNPWQGAALCAAEHGNVTGGVAPAENGCLDATPGGNEDPERIFDYVELSTEANDFTVADIQRNSPAFADIYDPALEGVGGADTAVDQLDIDWYLDSCSGADGSAKLEVTYTPIDIASLVPERAFTRVDVCGCVDDGDANGDGLYKCDPSAVSVSIDTETDRFYRLSFRPIDSDVKKISMVTLKNCPGTPPDPQCAPSDVPSQIAISVNGKYREAQATVNLRGVWKDALSGIFNYVLFSEESLIKSTPGQGVTPFDSLCGFCTNSLSGGPYYRCSADADCDAGEDCSIFNTASGDGMDDDESAPFCSDAPVDESETYSSLSTPPINQTDAGTCNAKCNGKTFCGDGVEQSPSGTNTGYSVCVGGTNNGVFCEVDIDCDSNDCQQTAQEECDYGAGNSDIIPDACRENCREPYCGDRVVDALAVWALGRAEECDDDNPVTNDACDTIGTTAAARGIPDSRCMLTTCGDGVEQHPNGFDYDEECDLGVLGNGSCPKTCSSLCTDNTCT